MSRFDAYRYDKRVHYPERVYPLGCAAVGCKSRAANSALRTVGFCRECRAILREHAEEMLQALDAGKLPLTDFRLLVNKACAVLGRIKGALTLPEAEALAMQAPVAPENLKDGPAAFSPEVVALLAAVLATARHASAGEVKVTKEGGS